MVKNILDLLRDLLKMSLNVPDNKTGQKLRFELTSESEAVDSLKKYIQKCYKKMNMNLLKEKDY